MVSMKHVFLGIGILLVIAIGSGCLSDEEKAIPSSKMPDYEELDQAGKVCMDCHYVVTNTLPTEGGKHNKECTFCHVEHGFKPECSKCHELQHGPQFKECKNCHYVHAPLKRITNLRDKTFENSCSACHISQLEEFSTHPGRHRDVKCIYCHPVHRQKMPCINCHAPHSKELTYIDCFNCHPAHKPQVVEYPENISRSNCAVCHGVQNDTLESGKTKHNSLNCSFCHPLHKQIPNCKDCHDPHTPSMTNEDCIGCHPAHDPLTIEFPEETPKSDCVNCHYEVNEILSNSKTKHSDLGCDYCHPVHRYLPTCESCHQMPHNRDIHDEFPSCDLCHIETHAVKDIVFNR